jgi:LCP family protein required for cell wall assembly
MPVPEEKNQTKLNDIVYSEPSAALRPKPKRGWIKIVLKTAVTILVLATAGLAVSVNLPAPDQVNNKVPDQKAGTFSWFSNFSIFSQLRQLAQSSDQKLKGEESDRINILLLGVSGKGHDGAFLTDTIILAGLKPSTGQVAMVSIPRDLSVPLEDMGWRKINNINAFAERANPGSGGQAASQAVSHLFNLPVDYYLTVDFTGFAKIIDELGGIRIYVENALDDYSYPILGQEDNPNYNARWEHLRVDAGWQEMNGELALKFARSRHGVGAEGSDFARARRQQKILEAVKDKILSINVLFKPRMIGQLIDSYREHLSTNLSVWEIVKLWSIFKDVKQEQIINKVLDNGPSGLLVDKIGEDGAYILLPRSGDFSQIEYLIKNIFAAAPQEEKTKIIKERASIEVRNGTWVNGLANRLATDLEKYGFRVVFVGNASQRNFQKSVIYDLTAGAKTESLAMLKEKTGANVAYGLPDWLKNDVAKSSSTRKQGGQPDFILVLGEDANTPNN